MIGSTQANHFLLKRFTSEQIIKVTLVYQGIIGIALVAASLYGGLGLYSLLILMFIFLTGQGLIGPNTTALSLAPFAKHAGSAAALLGSLRMSAGAIVSALVSVLHNGTILPMVGMMSVCVWISFLILITGNAVVKNKARNEDVEEEVSVLI